MCDFVATSILPTTVHLRKKLFVAQDFAWVDGIREINYKRDKAVP